MVIGTDSIGTCSCTYRINKIKYMTSILPADYNEGHKSRMPGTMTSSLNLVIYMYLNQLAIKTPRVNKSAVCVPYFVLHIYIT